jgi:hypothetical protein
MKNRILALLTSLAIASMSANAQSGSTGQILGQTYSSPLLNTLGTNPARFADPETKTNWSIFLPSFDVNAGTNNMSFSQINKYFGNKTPRSLNQSDKNDILSSFDEDGIFSTKADAQIIGFSINTSIGAFAFSMNEHAAAIFKAPKELIDLSLNGNAIGRTYSFNSAEGKAWWLRDYSLTYATQIYKLSPQEKGVFKEINIGVTAKYIQGFAYAGIENIDSYFTTDAKDMALKGYYKAIAYTSVAEDMHVKYDFDKNSGSKDPDYNPFMTPAGTGLGFDLGATFKLDNGLTISAALKDIGSVKWTNKVARFENTGTFFINDIFDQDQLDSLKDMNVENNKYVGSIKTDLPLNFQLGASVDMGKYLRGYTDFALFANYYQGLNSQPGNSLNPIFEIGGFAAMGNYLPFYAALLRYDETKSIRIPILFGWNVSPWSIGVKVGDILSSLSSSKSAPNVGTAVFMNLNF